MTLAKLVRVIFLSYVFVSITNVLHFNFVYTNVIV